MIALLLAIAPLSAADARKADPIRELAGAYQEPGSWVQIIPVDAGHAYVHLYFEGGIGHDLMSEFEQVMTVKGHTLTFHEPATAKDPGCSLTLQRMGGVLSWTAPERAPCAAYTNGHAPLLFTRGTMNVASRRPASRTRRYPGEGWGYIKTVSDWRKAGRR